MHPRDPYRRKPPVPEPDFFQGQLFYPSGKETKEWWTRHRIKVLIALLFLCFLSKRFPVLYVIVAFITLGWFVTTWIKAIQYIQRLEPLDGELGEYFRIYKDRIEYGDRTLSFHEIKNIELDINDFYGRDIRRGYYKWYYIDSPNNSQGTRNHIHITLKTGEELNDRFRIETENEKKYLYPFLINCVRSGIMSVSQAALHLGIYGEWDLMKEFKKEVGKPIETENQASTGTVYFRDERP